MKLKGNKICKSVSGCNFAHCERNTLIDTAGVINVNKMKSRELFIKIFLSILAWMLQFAVVAKLSFIADFFNLWGGDWFTLDWCDSKTQIYKVTDRNKDSRSDRGCWSYSDDLDFQEGVVWSGDDLEFGRCSISSCNSIKLIMLELL